METRMKDLLDELNLDEINKLLDEEIHFTVDSKMAGRIKSTVFRKAGIKKNFPWYGYSKRVMAASVIFLLMAVTSFAGGYHYYQTPVAYVDIDINPSIELGVNRWDKIVSAKGYNDEGKGILESQPVFNKDLKDGVENIIETANEQGFLSRPGGAAVSIALVNNQSDEAERLTGMCEETVKSYTKEQNLNVEVVTAQIALERKEEAEKLGITPGKLNLIQKLQVLDGDVEVENYKHTAVAEILKEIKELKKDRYNEEENNIEDIKDSIENSKVQEDKEKDDKNISDIPIPTKENNEKVKQDKAKTYQSQYREDKESSDYDSKDQIEDKESNNENQKIKKKYSSKVEEEKGKKNEKNSGKQWENKRVKAQNREQPADKPISKPDNKSEELPETIIDNKKIDNENRNNHSEKSKEGHEVTKQKTDEKSDENKEDKNSQNDSGTKETHENNGNGHKK